ncbi:MAG: chemotaxis protein CheW [Solirubrobacterales bacterium]
MNVAEDTTAKQLVVFVLGTEEYALPIQSVQEVIRFQQPRTVSSSDSSLLGVINLRGRIVPVHDVRPQLNIAGREVGEVRDNDDAEDGEKIVLINNEDRMAGVVVDDVSEVLTVDVSEFEDLPASGNVIVEGVVKSGDRLIILLDPTALTGLAGGQHAEAAA